MQYIDIQTRDWQMYQQFTIFPILETICLFIIFVYTACIQLNILTEARNLKIQCFRSKFNRYYN